MIKESGGSWWGCCVSRVNLGPGEELDGVGDDVFAFGAGSVNTDVTGRSFLEFVGSEGAEEFIVFGDVLLVDAESGFAFGVVDSDGSVGGAADVVGPKLCLL